MPDAFDFTTSDILDWELDLIHNALIREEIDIITHARMAARDEGIKLVELLEAILIGTAVSKDLPGNSLNRFSGINFEYQIRDGRWIRVKVAWSNDYAVITAHTIRGSI